MEQVITLEMKILRHTGSWHLVASHERQLFFWMFYT